MTTPTMAECTHASDLCGTGKKCSSNARRPIVAQYQETVAARTGVQLRIGHSMEFFRVVRKLPAW